MINGAAACGRASLDVATGERLEPRTSASNLVPGYLLHSHSDPQMGGFCHSLCPLQPEGRGQVEKEVLSPKRTGLCESGSGGEGPVMYASWSPPEPGPCALEQPGNERSSGAPALTCLGFGDNRYGADGHQTAPFPHSGSQKVKVTLLGSRLTVPPPWLFVSVHILL